MGRVISCLIKKYRLNYGRLDRIQTATDGETVLQSVATSPPDLILLDVKMPGIDGYEVCRRLKVDVSTQNIPIIFLTSFGADEDQT